jgi:ATP-dependent Lhr-like helicase
MLLTARHGAAEVGYVDPTVVSGDGREQRLLLAGRSWRVAEVEWRRKIVWLEPVPDGGRARWVGSPRSLGREICQGIRTVLAEGAPPKVRLSMRAQAELRSLMDEIPVTPRTTFTVEYDDQKPVRTWTYGGTRLNRTLARVASAAMGEKVRFDALSVQAPVVNLAGEVPDTIVLTEPEIAEFGASIKFSDAVPQSLS